jgi:Flp pilus assembly protein TadD
VTLSCWRDSVTLFERAVSVVGDNAMVQGNLGVALSYAGRSREAVARYQKALAIEPADPGLQANLGGELAVLGRLPEAEAHLLAALRFKTGGGRPLAEELRNNLGIVQIRLGKTNEAIAHFQQAMAINPGYARPYFNYGLALAGQGMWPEAVASYARAAQLDDNWPECLDALADAYAANGDFARAAATAELAGQKAAAKGLKSLGAELERKLAAFRAGQLPPPDSKPKTPNREPR